MISEGFVDGQVATQTKLPGVNIINSEWVIVHLTSLGVIIDQFYYAQIVNIINSECDIVQLTCLRMIIDQYYYAEIVNQTCHGSLTTQTKSVGVTIINFECVIGHVTN